MLKNIKAKKTSKHKLSLKRIEKLPQLIIDGKKYVLFSYSTSDYYYEKQLELGSFDVGFKSTFITDYFLKDDKGDHFKLQKPGNGDKKLFIFSKINKNKKVIKNIKFKKVGNTENLISEFCNCQKGCC